MSTGTRFTWARFRSRSGHELAFRGKQRVAAILERVGFGDTTEVALGDFSRFIRPDAGAEDAITWCRRFRLRPRSSFFAGFDDIAVTLARASEVDSGGVAAVRGVAQRVLDGRFDLLGHHDVSFGHPVDWHRDPLVGVTAPLVHWSRIAFLDPKVAGDHKLVWELNRHQWMASVAIAWRQTLDPVFPAAVNSLLNDWMDANPPKRGVNWSSSLEVAFRAIAWLWTLRFLAEADELRDATVLRAVGHLRLSARHLMANLSTYFSPNTHLTGEALALYYLGSELRDLREAEAWRATGRDVLLRCLPIHVRPDGTYFEQSTWYHRYTLDFYLHFWLFAQRGGDALPDSVKDAIGRLGTVLAHVARPDGNMPLIGDDDGGRMLFLDGRTSRDARPALAGAGLVSGIPLLCALGKATTETLLLFGADADERRMTLAAQPFTSTPSRLFPDGGLVVMRSGWAEDASVLVMDAGPHGVMNCGHAHADALAFELTLGGVPLFVDPGTLTYTVDRLNRDRLRASASHNCATVDGADSSSMAGPFSWWSKTDARVDCWSVSELGDIIAASHEGFGPPCRREVLRLPTPDGDVWILRDVFDASHGHLLEAHFQCASGISVLLDDSRLRLVAANVPVADVFGFGGKFVVEQGIVSPLYGSSHAAQHLRLACHSRKRSVLCTIIAPSSLQLTDVRHSELGRASAFAWSTQSLDCIVILSDGGAVEWRGVTVDALAFWSCSKRAADLACEWRAVGARRVCIGNRVLLDSGQPRDVQGGGDVPPHVAT